MNQALEDSHFGPKNQPWGGKTGTVAFWAYQPTGQLVIFVHGFMGEARATWTDFASLLPLSPKARGCDLVFFGYDGARKSVANSAGKLRVMLDILGARGGWAVNETMPLSKHRDADFQYNKIIIVAHSLGAVVARRALIDANDNGAAWTDRVKMALFAPAHLGADVLALAAEAITTLPYVGGVLAPALKWQWKVLRDLDPNSTTIRMLQDHTIQRIQKHGQKGWLVAARIYFGEFENIVNDGRFCDDPPPHPHLLDHGHRSLCKPTTDYRFPIDELVELL